MNKLEIGLLGEPLAQQVYKVIGLVHDVLVVPVVVELVLDTKAQIVLLELFPHPPVFLPRVPPPNGLPQVEFCSCHVLLDHKVVVDEGDDHVPLTPELLAGRVIKLRTPQLMHVLKCRFPEEVHNVIGIVVPRPWIGGVVVAVDLVVRVCDGVVPRYAPLVSAVCKGCRVVIAHNC